MKDPYATLELVARESDKPFHEVLAYYEGRYGLALEPPGHNHEECLIDSLEATLREFKVEGFYK